MTRSIWHLSACTPLAGWLAVIWLLADPVLAAPAPATSEIKSYAAWRDAIKKLPSNRALQGPGGATLGRLPPRNLFPLETFAEMDAQIRQFISLNQTGSLAQASLWVGGAPAKDPFYNPGRFYHVDPRVPFQPFAQKVVVPAGADVIFHGDFHGDIHSLMGLLEWLNHEGYMTGFQITRTNTYMVFLGDYTDRGMYGTEVTYTLLRLRLANPDRMFLARGNHEDITLMARYGFQSEGEAKYGRAFDSLKISKIYDFLPPVIYLGCGTNFIQCNHGGMEPGYRPAALLDAEGPVRFQLLGALNERAFLAANLNWFQAADAGTRSTATQYYQDFIPTSPTTPSLLGFMWNDFTLVKQQDKLALDPGRGFVYGDALTRLILEQAGSGRNKVRAVFRAHQHSIAPNPMMHRLIVGKGVFRHWQATDSADLLGADEDKLVIERQSPRTILEFSVWTFNVACDSLYGAECHFSFDTFGILKVADSFDQWKLTVVNQEIRP